MDSSHPLVIVSDDIGMWFGLGAKLCPGRIFLVLLNHGTWRKAGEYFAIISCNIPMHESRSINSVSAVINDHAWPFPCKHAFSDRKESNLDTSI